MLPHVAGRPLSLVRCPTGQGKECFYQKHISKGLPAGLREVMIKESEGEEPYPVLDGVEGLLALVQMNVLEIHPWGSRADDVERPDRLIFDLDPDPSVGWAKVVEAGFEIRERLAAMKLDELRQDHRRQGTACRRADHPAPGVAGGEGVLRGGGYRRGARQPGALHDQHGEGGAPR